MGNQESNSLSFAGGKDPQIPQRPASSQPQQKNATVSTAQKLKATISRLEKRRDFLQKKIVFEVNHAKEKAKAKNRQGALLHIKKKKVYEKDVTKLEGMIFTLEQQAMAVEAGSVNHDVVQAMKQGVSAQKRINEQVDADKTAEMMDEIRDMQEDMNEVSEMLAQPLDDVTQDEDLLEELAGLEIENSAELEAQVDTLPAAPTAQPSATQSSKGRAAAKVAATLPKVPTHQVEAAQTKEGLTEDEIALKALEAEMQ